MMNTLAFGASKPPYLTHNFLAKGINQHPGTPTALHERLVTDGAIARFTGTHEI